MVLFSWCHWVHVRPLSGGWNEFLHYIFCVNVTFTFKYFKRLNVSHFLLSFSFISFSILVFAVRFKQTHFSKIATPSSWSGGIPVCWLSSGEKGVERGGGLAFQEVSPCSLWLPENVQSQILLLPVAKQYPKSFHLENCRSFMFFVLFFLFFHWGQKVHFWDLFVPFGSALQTCPQKIKGSIKYVTTWFWRQMTTPAVWSV